MKTRWKKLTSLMLAAAMTAGTVGTAPLSVNAEDAVSDAWKEFYVAADGDDNAEGTADAPFKTIERARAAVDEINEDMEGDIIVNIGAGDYYLDDTLVLDEGDSGQNGHEVIYRSVDGNGEAKLHGGTKLDGTKWTLADKTDVDNYDLDESMLGKVYKMDLKEKGWDFNTLYVNDTRATMARTRNRDNNPYFPMAKGEYMRSTGGHNNNLNMNYRASDLTEKEIAGMENAQARGEEVAQVFVWDGGDWDWFTNTIPIATINTAKNEFKFPTPPADYPEKYRTKYNIGGGARYFLQGNLAFMDVEGEYHYNKSTGVLYYYPKAEDGAIEEQTIVVPTMEKAVYFKGADKANLADQPDPEKQVHDITIDGLAVEDTAFPTYFTYSWNWGDTDAGIRHFPKAAEGSSNPSYCESTDREEFKSGSITLTGTHDITIKNTRVKNSGLYGIIYAGDNQNNTLTQSVIEKTGYGGVIFDGGYPGIGKYNNHNTVDNVLIHEVGELVGHAIGLHIMSSGQNNFTNLEIYDTPKRALLVLGGYRRDRYGADKNYDEIKDMYTVGNHFKYIHVHDAQQDAGEDSAVFLSWLLSGKDVQALHGSNDPNNLKTNLDGIDTTIDRYNYFDQMLITDVGADPSVIEKCTVGGLDTAMGATGTQFKNIQAANTQHHLLAIRPGSYGDMYNYENCTNNVQDVTHSDELKTFDNSKMEYEKIGLRPEFPSEYKQAKREYDKAPEELYFGDDFEASRELDTTKWYVEKGNMEMHHGYGAMSEDPKEGRRSLPIDGDLNPGGIVVSRGFENDLNKIVEVKYLDRRKDYAGNDAVDSGRTGILPNSFLRVDDGENALGIGAVGRKSKDYYMIKKGDELIQTNVRRCFGWHTFKFDYTSGTDVKLYIDDQLIATYDDVPTSFNYIAMGDWEGLGGKAFFDQLYVYGGEDAPPVKPLGEPLKRIEIEPKESEDHKSITVDVKGFDKDDNAMDMSDARVTFVVEDENVAKVDENGTITGVNAGSTKVIVKVRKYPGAAEDFFYVGVDKDGNITSKAYLVSVKTVLKGNLIDNADHKSIKVDFSGKLNSGDDADLTNANITAEFSNDNFAFENGKITAKETISENELVTVKFTVTLDSAVIESETFEFVAAGDYEAFAAPGRIEAEEGIVTGEAVRIGNEDGGKALTYIKQGDVYTYIVDAAKAGKYEVSYRTAAESAGKGVQCYVNGKLQSEQKFGGSGWTVYETSVQEQPITLKKGLNIITMKPVGSGYLFNFNWFELAKLKDSMFEEDFESENPTTFATQKGNAKVEIVEEDGNKVMHVTSPDDLVYYENGMDWSNYTLECKIKINNWGVDGAAYDWDNMAPVWNAGRQDDKGNFNRYSLKYRRASQDFALYRRYNGDTDMVSKAAPTPEEYNGKWHDYKITTIDGLITAYIDGEKIFEHRDNANTKGTIGFDGISVDYSVDDIVVSKAVKPADKTALTEVYNQYKDLANDNYTEESWAAFQSALKAAKAVLDDTDAAQEDVDAAAEAVQDAVAELEQNRDTIDQNFTITVDGKIEEHAYNDAVTITAEAVKDGKNFAYWTADGEIVSYKPEYKFYVSRSMVFTAVYENEVLEEAKALLTNVFAKQREDGKTDVTFVGELVIPEGYEIENAGLIWSSKDTELILNKDTEPELNPALKPTFISKISDTNQFSVTIKGMPQGKFIRGSIFATITNGTEKKVIYSTEDKVTAK